MKSKEYVDSVLHDLDSMIESFRGVRNPVDRLELDEEIINVMSESFPINRKYEPRYRGIPVTIKTEPQWGSMYNFIAYKDGYKMFQHYTLLG